MDSIIYLTVRSKVNRRYCKRRLHRIVQRIRVAIRDRRTNGIVPYAETPRYRGAVRGILLVRRERNPGGIVKSSIEKTDGLPPSIGLRDEAQLINRK